MRLLTVTVYLAVLAVIGVFVTVGFKSPTEKNTVARLDSSSDQSILTVDSKPSVDQVVSVDLAASAANTANLAVVNHVENSAESLNEKAKVTQVQTDETTVAKPQIVQPTQADTQPITAYKSVKGDNAKTIAKKFGLTERTVRWSNHLSSSKVAVGADVLIPSVDGFVYTVKNGDSVASLAKKYKSDADAIVTINDLEISGLKPGKKIVVPDGILPEDERPGYVDPTDETETTSRSPNGQSFDTTYSSASPSSGSGMQVLYVNSKSTTAGNRNYWGNCTWYAWERRLEMGKPLPAAVLGNAYSWASSLAGYGYKVDNTPSVGAVMQTSYGGGGYGHVMIVEEVYANGSVRVSEMNAAGYNVVSTRTFSAGQASSYNFIH